MSVYHLSKVIAGLRAMMEDDVGNHKRNTFSLKPAHEVAASKLESSEGRESAVTSGGDS